MVVEADESDGTFLKLPADIAVVTNIDPDHLDHFGTFDAIKDAFRALSRIYRSTVSRSCASITRRAGTGRGSKERRVLHLRGKSAGRCEAAGLDLSGGVSRDLRMIRDREVAQRH